MATVTITWKSGNETSFETSDPEVIARYEGYGHTDPQITNVNVKD